MEPQPSDQIPEPHQDPTPTASQIEPRGQDGLVEMEPYEWQATEFMHHEKSLSWYLYLAAGLAVLLGIAVFTRQWLLIALFATMAGAIVVYARKPPRVLQYRIDADGITIEDKSYPFGFFLSFAILPDAEWHAIDLEPTRRFMPRLTLLFTDDSLNDIASRLELQLPRVDREPDFIERLSRRVRF